LAVQSEFDAKPSPVLPARATAGLANPTALATFQRHWSDYCKEAAGLPGFVIVAGSATTLLEYAGSPVRAAIGSEALRRVVFGSVLAVYFAGLVYSRWGRRTGTHVTLR